MTVRFRDGSTTVLHEASARDWHPGVRVIVIGGRRRDERPDGPAHAGCAAGTATPQIGLGPPLRPPC